MLLRWRKTKGQLMMMLCRVCVFVCAHMIPSRRLRSLSTPSVDQSPVIHPSGTRLSRCVQESPLRSHHFILLLLPLTSSSSSTPSLHILNLFLNITFPSLSSSCFFFCAPPQLLLQNLFSSSRSLPPYLLYSPVFLLLTSTLGQSSRYESRQTRRD